MRPTLPLCGLRPTMPRQVPASRSSNRPDGVAYRFGVHPFDDSWVQAVTAECDFVFDSAQVGFRRQVMRDGDEGTATALLWEAKPVLFAARYPDSGIVETYGTEQWPNVSCIDWWVYIDLDTMRARISVEGWNLPDLWLPLSGDGGQDGCDLADVFARFLNVPSPRVE